MPGSPTFTGPKGSLIIFQLVSNERSCSFEQFKLIIIKTSIIWIRLSPWFQFAFFCSHLFQKAAENPRRTKDIGSCLNRRVLCILPLEIIELLRQNNRGLWTKHCRFLMKKKRTTNSLLTFMRDVLVTLKISNISNNWRESYLFYYS